MARRTPSPEQVELFTAVAIAVIGALQKTGELKPRHIHLRPEHAAGPIAVQLKNVARSPAARAWARDLLRAIADKM